MAFSAVALVGVVWWIVNQDRPTLPSSSREVSALLAAIAAYGAGTAVRAERWLRLLRLSGASPSRGDAHGLTVVGYMGNNVLPARGGDVMRIYLMAAHAGTTKRAVLGTLIAERLLDVIVLFLIFVVLAYAILQEVEAPSGFVLAAITAATVLVAILGLAAIAYVRRERLFARFRRWARPISAATRGLRGRRGLEIALLTVAVWALEASTYLGVGYAVDWTLDPIEALYLVALTGLFVVIPAGPSNAGTLDAGVLLGVRSLSGSSSQAISYLLVLRFVLLMPITLAGLVLLVTRYGGLGRFRTGDDAPSAA